jgi:hypothetical protein
MPIATPTMQGVQAQNAAVSTMNPTLINKGNLVTPDAVTAQQELAGILNKGGALMQQSANMGNAQAASRGLLNSSMGIQAAQNAMIQNAAPIAQSDAAAKNNANFQNANTLNTAETTNTNILNSSNQWNAQQQNANSQFNVQQNNAMNQWNAAQQNEATLKAMDVNSRETLANIEANYKQLMQVNSSAGGLYEQVMKNISDIQNNKDIADKQGAINSQLSWLRSGMGMIQNLNGVSGLITF